MYQWKDDAWQAWENMQTAIKSIETAKASSNLGYEEAKVLDAILLNLNETVSLIIQLFTIATGRGDERSISPVSCEETISYSQM